MIVTTPWRDIARTKTVVLVVCSTEFDEPPKDDEVLLPHDTQGRTITQLREPTAAVCDWIVSFAVGDIKETAGIVPTEILKTICTKAGILFIAER